MSDKTISLVDPAPDYLHRTREQLPQTLSRDILIDAIYLYYEAVSQSRRKNFIKRSNRFVIRGEIVNGRLQIICDE